MKNLRTVFLLLSFIFLFTATTRAVVFTSNTAISAVDASYDGADIVVSNCTVTVDGAHSFASLQVANGGVLTHSFYPNASTSFFVSAVDEAQVLSSTNPTTLLHTNVSLPVTVTDLSHTTTYNNDVDYVAVPQPDGTTQLMWTNTSAITDGATVLVSYTWSYSVKAGLNLTVTNDVAVASGGTISANGIGYASNFGTGRGFTSTGSFQDGSGAGYGGNGGSSSSNAIGGICYGSVSLPANPGSGGGSSYAGSGGNGGGLVQIVAGGSINIDGLISVNGADATNSRAGGGAGGGVWLSAASVSGAGSIAANGGAGEPVHGGGAGGGRIAIQCNTNNFSGSLIAIGGNGWKIGGAGTIYTKVNGQNGFLLVDNGGRAGTNSTITLPSNTDVLIRSNARVIPSGTWTAGNVTIATGGKLVALSQTIMTLNVTGTLAVQSGGAITADGMGYAAGSGTGPGHAYSAGPYYPCSGAGHGGTGALGSPTNSSATVGGTYGSQTSPNSSDFGSGGGTYSTFSFGGSGGGVLSITVNGTLQVDGTISANGSNGSGTGGGGGSGGGIALTATTITGNGAILANGGSGAGTAGGGGGGGRIAINSSVNNFSGTVNAAGGGGANYGGAGTYYNHQTVGNVYQLILDNAGHAGTNTPLQSISQASLIVRNGAIGSASSSVNFSSLNIFSNGWLAAIGATAPSSLVLTISGDATIEPGGGITGDLLGYAANNGIGGGTAGSSYNPPYSGNGGGHGGAGGRGTYDYSLGNPGAVNDSVPSPSYAGSGGGGNNTASLGGRGGGIIQLTVNGKLQVDGVISANAGNGSGSGGGGGSGGAINLSVGTLIGSGAIRANGGNGVDAIGGGGGGGCIAIYFSTNNFSGGLTAYGGSGYNYGGAGTIYLKTNSVNRASLIVDNGGHAGANSAMLSSPTTDTTLQNGALAFANNSLFVGNLLISSNSWIIITNGTQVATWTLNASGNVTVQSGGGISADALGYRQGQGSGAGGNYASAPYYPSGGGGHAGYGSNPSTYVTSIGGIAGYDSLSAPTLAGGAGGGYNTYSYGGNGGGVIQMTITGNLQVDGTLSANGGNGSGTGGGGGAGGSINLTSGNLLGSGMISVNGGNGVIGVGGGGGGGNIACSFTSNLFLGTFSASGGGTTNYGGAGLIYLRTNSTNQSVIIADNAGHRGANTPVSSAASSSGLIIRNGAIVTPSSSSLQVIANLLINSNGWFMPANNSGGSLQLTVNGNATLQSGGGILADAVGSTSGLGSGHGNYSGVSPFYQSSGAGHGGYGGNGISNSITPIGGITYDSTTSPTSTGSGGGGNGTYSFGGSGGGYVNLHVNGALQLDGIISVNGGNGSSGGGGGSGGSLNLNFNSLTGSGSITANGGSGAVNMGGGGGGGRIAVYFNSNNFTGAVTAYGGGGANYGGAGTIYFKNNSQNYYGLLVLDNANNAGTNTAFDFINMDVTIQNKAVGLLPSSGSWSAHDIFIRTNGVLTAPASTVSRTLSANNLTIDAGGALALDGAGYASSVGPGNALYGGTGNIRGGAGHGGYGGGNVSGYGKAYDSISSPANPGSGGGGYSSGNGGAGGGALLLSINGPGGILTVNGRLSANGGNGDYGAGGGSGGSLNFTFINKLLGSGVISATGGTATGAAGGGGGRIAFNTVISNNFTGQISAAGGNALYPGGAGTIYTRVGNTRTLLVDNGGILGTNTPLSSSYSVPTSPFDLTISGAATVVPLTLLPIMSNLTISAGSTLTMAGAQSNLTVAVLKDFNLAGTVNLDSKGYAQANGPGAGTNISNKGSGGGYGGPGGNSSSGAIGGTNYGSATKPLDFGSGGGSGLNNITGGSQGGGALRISVGGKLNIDGSISANGNFGWSDDSGGGAGGSVWLSASTLTGPGNISAAGGDGELLGGGGGGGGRIAIYYRTNLFAGTTNANGGSGAFPGQPGSIFASTIFPDFQIISQSPTGIVANTVSSVDLTFNEAIDNASASSANFTLITPAGPVAPENMSVTAPDLATLRVSFPVQNLLGDYSIQVTTDLKNIFGVPLAQTYTNGFTIMLPTISGTVTNLNGAPVAGVLLQPDGGLIGATTDASGNYSIGVPTGWNGSITPSFGMLMFVPGTLSYTSLPGSVTNQNYLMVPTVAPTLVSGVSGTNLSMSWTGIPGVTYQTWWSTNLVDWSPLGDPLAGTNGQMQILLPLGTDPADFFRLGATN